MKHAVFTQTGEQLAASPRYGLLEFRNKPGLVRRASRPICRLARGVMNAKRYCGSGGGPVVRLNTVEFLERVDEWDCPSKRECGNPRNTAQNVSAVAAMSSGPMRPWVWWQRADGAHASPKAGSGGLGEGALVAFHWPGLHALFRPTITTTRSTRGSYAADDRQGVDRPGVRSRWRLTQGLIWEYRKGEGVVEGRVRRGRGGPSEARPGSGDPGAERSAERPGGLRPASPRSEPFRLAGHSRPQAAWPSAARGRRGPSRPSLGARRVCSPRGNPVVQMRRQARRLREDPAPNPAGRLGGHATGQGQRSVVHLIRVVYGQAEKNWRRFARARMPRPCRRIQHVESATHVWLRVDPGSRTALLPW